MVLWWGFHCHPHLRAAFALVYYCAGAACVWGAVSARSSLGRAVLMLVLLLMRVAVFVVRLGVAAHPTPALWHYFAMEVGVAGGLGMWSGDSRRHTHVLPLPLVCLRGDASYVCVPLLMLAHPVTLNSFASLDIKHVFILPPRPAFSPGLLSGGRRAQRAAHP